MRDIMNLLSEGSAEDGWERIQGPILDVTGDYRTDIPNEYNAHDLVKQYPADPNLGEMARDVYVLMNPEKTIKVIMYPTYDGANGEYHSITVYKKV